MTPSAEAIRRILTTLRILPWAKFLWCTETNQSDRWNQTTPAASTSRHAWASYPKPATKTDEGNDITCEDYPNGYSYTLCKIMKSREAIYRTTPIMTGNRMRRHWRLWRKLYEESLQLSEFVLSEISIHLDGNTQPIRQLKPNYAGRQYVQAFMSLFRNRQENGDKATALRVKTTKPLCVVRHWLELGSRQRRKLQLGQARDRSTQISSGSTEHVSVVAYAEFKNVVDMYFKTWKKPTRNCTLGRDNVHLRATIKIIFIHCLFVSHFCILYLVPGRLSPSHFIRICFFVYIFWVMSCEKR